MRRRRWILVLSAGVILGFGSGFAHLFGHGHHGACHGAHELSPSRGEAPAAAGFAPPQTVVVQPAPAPGAQVFIVTPGAAAPVAVAPATR